MAATVTTMRLEVSYPAVFVTDVGRLWPAILKDGSALPAHSLDLRAAVAADHFDVDDFTIDALMAGDRKIVNSAQLARFFHLL
jgi:hypothetical protein